MMGTLIRLVNRIQRDCRVSSYELAYSAFLEAARQRGYDMITLIDSLERFRRGTSTRPCVAIRHDVDINNVAGNRRFFQVEQAQGATATYYFRLCTAPSHQALINHLLHAGFEVGYHFEEGAEVAKQRQLNTREAVFCCRDEIQEQFKNNCELFRQRYNPHLRSVSAHGDWINRHLKFSNNDLVDETLLAQCGLDLEAYNSTFKGYFNLSLTDVYLSPEIWKGENDWIDRFRGVSGSVHILAHERQWYPSPLVNMGENIKRLTETIRYHIPTRRHSK